MKIDRLSLLLLLLAVGLAFGPQIAPIPPAPPPVPVDPTPVDPQPGPPPPVVDTNPIPGPTPGLRVLVLREAQAATTPAELAVLQAPAVIELLNRSCAHNVNNQPEWRVWDDDMPPDVLKYVGEHWQKAYERAKQESGGKLPWLLLGSGLQGKSVPLPATADELQRLVAEVQ